MSVNGKGKSHYVNNDANLRIFSDLSMIGCDILSKITTFVVKIIATYVSEIENQL